MPTLQKNKPIIFLIFGATGRLTFDKIIPAFYNLYSNSDISQNLKLVCIGRKEQTTDQYISNLESSISKSPDLRFRQEEWNRFANTINYISGDLENADLYSEISEYISTIIQPESKLFFYQAAPHTLSSNIVQNINESGLKTYFEESEVGNLIFEHPYGRDVMSANELQKSVLKFTTEDHIYRVQNKLAPSDIDLIRRIKSFNPIVEELLQSELITNVLVTHSESKGVGERGEFFDKVGIIGETLQPYIMPILAMLLSPSTTKKGKDDISKEVLKQLDPIEPDELILAQYEKGIYDGRLLTAFHHEVGIENDSTTPTFVAFKTALKKDDHRIPIFVKVGKRLKNNITEIQFIFQSPNSEGSNLLCFRFRPKAEIYMVLNKKDRKNLPITERMILATNQKVVDEKVSDNKDIYEEILQNIINERRDRFTNYSELIESWRFTEQIEISLANNATTLTTYTSGSSGPESLNKLNERLI